MYIQIIIINIKLININIHYINYINIILCLQDCYIYEQYIMNKGNVNNNYLIRLTIMMVSNRLYDSFNNNYIYIYI